MNRPNILYIMSDDHSSNAISCYHSILEKVFQTPNIDRIAVEGCRMDAIVRQMQSVRRQGHLL